MKLMRRHLREFHKMFHSITSNPILRSSYSNNRIPIFTFYNEKRSCVLMCLCNARTVSFQLPSKRLVSVFSVAQGGQIDNWICFRFRLLWNHLWVSDTRQMCQYDNDVYTPRATVILVAEFVKCHFN